MVIFKLNTRTECIDTTLSGQIWTKITVVLPPNDLAYITLLYKKPN